MIPKPSLRCSVLTFALGAMGCLATLPAQDASPLTKGKQMLATEQFLFVVHEGVLHKYDIKSLKLIKAVPLTTKKELDKRAADQRMLEAKARAEKALEKRLQQPTPKAPSNADTRMTVERALAWLKSHQDRDGKWDADGFMKHDQKDLEICNGPGNAIYDVGVTGLSVMALLTAGDDHKREVRRAISWLHKQQGEDGLFGTNNSHDFIYNHAVATYATCRAMQELDRNDALMKPMVQKAINYLESHRNPYAVWRYQPRDNDNDTSVTTWCLLAYTAAKDLGIKVNKNALKLGSVWMDQVSSPDGHHGYSRRKEQSSRMRGAHATKFPREKGEAMTAAALLSRYRLDETPEGKPIMARAARLLLSKPPKWDQKAGTIDEYYWLFGTLALSHAGGETWRKWASHLTAAVAENQQDKGNLAGSWDPVGVWGESGGRVFSTAMLALACDATLSKP